MGEPSRATRMPRDARRTQLLDAARSVFVSNGYHAAAMDDIAESAGVSKPVVYQHFGSKLDLYLALLDESTEALVVTVQNAIASTDENHSRVEAAVAAYFAFVDEGSEDFRLVFESDLGNMVEVRERLDQSERACAAAIAAAIGEQTGLSVAEAMLLGTALAGTARVSAQAWLSAGRPFPREHACELVIALVWRGLAAFPVMAAPPTAAVPVGPAASGDHVR
ncbi:MAG TPA: TetR/AcrR family transcriptional regulator [Actinopolymorphaceae bacterium]|jgi:AcrR family transcriptional regulator